MKKVTEKERRWLLKQLPELQWDQVIEIIQIYVDGFRYRCSLEKGKLTYEKIKKVAIGIGHNEEIDVEEITLEQWQEVLPFAERFMQKTRYVKNQNGYKFEIDVPTKIRLVMLEIEGVEMTDIINFPVEISFYLIMEVTGIKELNNYNLALPC
jgi:CYTH domain-containing protein